ncbi:LuxR family transcriptional regulator, partial [Paracoccus liaowanqingii]
HEGARQFGVLHHLSAAETSIVQALVDGLKIEQIAQARGTSPDTVRTQLKSIFAKTGCSRQSDVVRHVAAMVSPGQHGLR